MNYVARGLAALSLAAALFATPAAAIEIINTGQPPVANGGAGLGSSQWLALRFRLDPGITITSIKGWIGVSEGSSLTVALHAGDVGQPGAVLHEVAVDLGPGELPSAWRGAEGLNWDVGPGFYWASFRVLPGQDFNGYMPPGATIPLAVVRGDQGGWVNQVNADLGWAIDGTVSAIPEPGTWALLILGFGLAGGALRRRHSAGKAVVRAM